MLDAMERQMKAETKELEDEIAQMEELLNRDRAAFERERLAWEEENQNKQVDELKGATRTSATLPVAHSGQSLGDRVMGELLREKSKSKKFSIFSN
ncbi:hypothetical protein Ciccas_009478 [Cichlidogyrus casuarinus]|uniref:Uncharacterized protein n=1 Tax=Cichlidogyrus casuarinus TaxID=1844966 RepID=A0ABD2PWY7_9PLAT